MKSTGKVATIEGYIHAIAENKLTNYISRGENKNYEFMRASAFRNPEYRNFNIMVERFYSYIGNTLTDMQHDHFLAFA